MTYKHQIITVLFANKESGQGVNAVKTVCYCLVSKM